MKKIHLNQVPVVPSKRSVWVKTANAHYQCGDVQIRLMRKEWHGGITGSYLHKTYGLWIMQDGKWRRCRPKGRKADYGGLGAAKIGASRTQTFRLKDGSEVKRGASR